MEKPTFSIVIPAHNEEQYIGKCLEAIRTAAKQVPDCGIQIIVAANRCTDRTAEIAKQYGAEVVEDGSRCIAAVRNTGAKAARGEYLVTVDADSYMAPDALKQVREKLESGKFIGGGANPRFERASPGIFFTTLYIAVHLVPVMLRSGGMLSGAMFWCRKADFDAVGGFDETLVSLEDLDFAKRLRDYGKRSGKKYGTLKGWLITSARKFDQFGDWYLLKNRKMTKAIFTGKDREAANRYYYDAR